MHIGERATFSVVVAVLLALNFITLLQAYPETFRLDAGCCVLPDRQLAKDFSAFYTGAWRLIHDPAQIYTKGFVDDGEFHILPQPQPYKYLPSFLFMVSPFTLLPYQSGLIAFDAFQFLLLPLMALMIYRIAVRHSLRTKVILAVLVVLLPVPLRVNEMSISTPYFWQWAEGQSKVLETFLIILFVHLARSGKPRLSGVAFGLAAFDPRFAILSVPLFLGYNSNLRSAVAYGIGTLAVTNLPLVYPRTLQGFLSMTSGSGLTTPVYYYAWIPVVTVVSLTLLGRKEIAHALKRIGLHAGESPDTGPGGQTQPR